MVRNLYTLSYNCYLNRLEMGYKTIAEYEPYVVDKFSNINFQYTDGVDTTQIVNIPYDRADDPNYYSIDYAIVTYYDPARMTEVIESRWFVAETERTRGSQFRLSLHRDVIYDAKDAFLDSTAFIKKGLITSTEDICIFNPEPNFSCNQIKQSEHLLKDATGVPWIVGYLTGTTEDTDCIYSDKQATGNGTIEITQAQFDNLQDDGFDLVSNFDAEPYKLCYSIPSGFTYIENGAKTNLKMGMRLFFNEDQSSSGDCAYYLPKPTISSWQGYYINKWLLEGVSKNEKYYSILSQGAKAIALSMQIRYGSISLRNHMSYTLRNYISSHYRSSLTYDRLKGYKYIRIRESGAIYRIRGFHSIPNRAIHVQDTTQAYVNEVIRLMNLQTSKHGINYVTTENSSGGDTLTPNNVYLDIYGEYPVEHITLDRVSDDGSGELGNGYKVTIKSSNARPFLKNQPYSMFCMPFYDYKFVAYDGNTYDWLSQHSIAAAQAISEKFKGTNTLLDLQILPYCPLTSHYNANKTAIDFNTFTGGGYEAPFFVIPILHNNIESGGYMIWCTEDTFTLDIPFNINIDYAPIKFKVNQQTTFCRLNSPNYSGIYEFNAYKNYGVDRFNIDCTYKPYAPWIHINPNYKGLYNQDFDDSRGLICSGDFSLPQITNAWETYQVQNKNYQASFDRNIQTTETLNSYQKTQDKWNAAAGAVSALVSGATSGGMIGGPKGAIAGGVIAGVASGIAGAADVRINQDIRELQLDNTKAQFQYGIENIQALPQSLANVGCLTKNNKIWPFLELYNCTEQESRMLEDIITYEGMTVNKIGVVRDYIGYYDPNLPVEQQTTAFVQGSFKNIALREDVNYQAEVERAFRAGFRIRVEE